MSKIKREEPGTIDELLKSIESDMQEALRELSSLRDMLPESALTSGIYREEAPKPKVLTRVEREEVRELIQKSQILSDSVKLPAWLPRPLYLRVAEVLEQSGGKWNKRRGVHRFTSDPREKLADWLTTGITHKKKAQAFYTPEPVAELVAKTLDCRGRRVLEPSAGKGALAETCAAYGAIDVDCVEMDPEAADVLRDAGFAVVNKDFLLLKNFGGRHAYTRIAMNPPFTRHQDVLHVRHAYDNFLGRGGKLVAVMLDNQDHKSFKELRVDLEIM